MGSPWAATVVEADADVSPHARTRRTQLARTRRAAPSTHSPDTPRELLGDDLKPAVDRLDCASAIALDRKTGEAPIPQNLFGAPLPGTYDIELANPCGRLSVAVGKPWS